MRVYRIERKKYLSSTLRGIGASMTDGFRWNSRNTLMIYTAASRALAILEVTAHLDSSEDLPSDRHIVEIDISESVRILELIEDALPLIWDSKPPSVVTQYIGDDFVRGNTAAVLRVPSSIVPDEYNYLINPNHPDANKINVIKTMELVFDERLRRGK